MPDRDDTLDLLLRLQMTPGVGPVLARRMLTLFDDPRELFETSHAQLQRVEGIGPTKAKSIGAGLRASGDEAKAERERCERAGVALIHLRDPRYPALLAEVPDAPLVLSVRGRLGPEIATHTVAIVGSRRCTAYGMEQAERFSTMLSQAGITVVSGGARGIDSAAHRAAARIERPTIVVLGCGIGRCYPPENAELFDRVVATGGAIVSELPFETNPSPENFPARNRIISGLSLGVILIEAPVGSGALITARHAVDEHGREVMAVPGRVDSRASEGCHRLIRKLEAALVTCPADVIDQLESQARHVHEGTHAARFGGADAGELFAGARGASSGGAAGGAAPASPGASAADAAIASLTPTQRRILEALAEPGSLDALETRTGFAPEVLRAEVTAMEIRRLIRRQGAEFRRREGATTG